jgi:hypothetical protein
MKINQTRRAEMIKGSGCSESSLTIFYSGGLSICLLLAFKKSQIMTTVLAMVIMTFMNYMSIWFPFDLEWLFWWHQFINLIFIRQIFKGSLMVCGENSIILMLWFWW